MITYSTFSDAYHALDKLQRALAHDLMLIAEEYTAEEMDGGLLGQGIVLKSMCDELEDFLDAIEHMRNEGVEALDEGRAAHRREVMRREAEAMQ